MRIVLTLGITAVFAAAAPAMASAAEQAPTREQLKRMLLTPGELAPLTKTTWTVQPALAGDSPASTTGCTGLDTAVLASNTGLVDSGPFDFLAANGDLIEQNIAYDPDSAAHVKQLAAAITDCPAMTFDGMSVPIKTMPIGTNPDRIAAFRVYIDGVSRSVVLTASHGDYVVELIASDHNFDEAYYQGLLSAAFAKVDSVR
ncbi:hypothetical protein F4553_001248 [Allocatelliglobosispora scoriae]|uniref:Sensor domain-containing protein n=1 Tax=Allocatelliglobosispora scoriae TaxID=643052 RepID=A0A841BKZ8_9ACTN|nr:hypothetical protein [Allocatelliglobosispora scoriae]MBB5867869.1 hypothetical protein [Allocatelliglobosispora scoriae]